MSKFAVTGANGMTGRHMVNLLKIKKISVKAITRKEWDLTVWKSFNELDYIFGSSEVIFHFGAQLPLDDLVEGNQQSQQLFDTNIRSCLNLAEWASIRNIAIVFLSTAVVYKNPYSPRILEDDSKVVSGFGGLYGYSKLLAEGIFNYWSENNLKCIILRPSSLYGYGLPSNKLIQSFLNIAASGGELKVKGSGNQVNFIHANDVSNAAWQAYLAEAWGVFNISSDSTNSILDVAKIAISISKNGSISILDKSDNDNFIRFNLNSDSAKKYFAFKPLISLKSGMTMMKNKTVIFP